MLEYHSCFPTRQYRNAIILYSTRAPIIGVSPRSTSRSRSAFSSFVPTDDICNMASMTALAGSTRQLCEVVDSKVYSVSLRKHYSSVGPRRKARTVYAQSSSLSNGIILHQRAAFVCHQICSLAADDTLVFTDG